MPKFLKNILQSEAASKGFSGKREDRYVYGAMNNLGYMRGSAETSKGRALQAKHNRDVKSGKAQPHPHRNLGKYLHRSKKSPY
jgi:hypothetical protein